MTVGFFSLEMSKEQLFMRMLTSEARIDAHRLRGGFLGEHDWGRLSQAIGTLSEAKIFIDDTRVDRRARDARQVPAARGRARPATCVIIDYIQLMQGRGRFENRHARARVDLAVAEGARQGAERPDRRAVAAQSRAPEARSDHRPQLSDLRESGALEQDADVVIFIYREDMYADKTSRRPTRRASPS